MDFKHLSLSSADTTRLTLDELYKLAPSCFTEARDANSGELRHVVDFKKLRRLLGDDAVEDEPEAYEFTWVGKQAAKREAATPINKTLRPVPERSEDWDNTQNIYIEGDNLDALKLLQKSYLGKVKMIYIDPPYNTGNDFVYHDDYKQTAKEYNLNAGYKDELGNCFVKNTDTNGKFHSDWCSMIYPRLQLAHSLLRDDGVIFISIDDHEVDNLRKICDEVFGESNFLNQFVWINKPEGRQINGGGAAGTHEYILVYARDASIINAFSLKAEWLKDIMPSSYKSSNFEVKEDAKGTYITTHELYNGNSKFNEETRPTLVFDIYYRESDSDVIIEDVSDTNLHPDYAKISPHVNADGIHQYHAYRWSKEKILKEKDDLEFIKSGDTFRVYTKRRDFDVTNVRDIVTDLNTISGTKDIMELDVNGFSYPKPVSLLRLLTNIATTYVDDEGLRVNDEAIVLDFFSGSATTAHATMLLNREDGGKRKFIMVQLPEETGEDSEAYKAGYKNICELGEERIRRAGKKIREEVKEKEPELFDSVELWGGATCIRYRLSCVSDRFRKHERCLLCA